MGLYIGLMSGTSADAIDVALVEIEPSSIAVRASISQPLPESVRTEIFALFDSGTDEIDRMGNLDQRLAVLFADAVNSLLKQQSVTSAEITAIGSHGQTIRHRPRPPKGAPFTLQIGDPNTIAELTRITTVADFRRRDMACGGQGAPLTPGFHQAVFGHAVEARAVLNIGGIANVTVLRPDRPVLGFDTGPGNGLMDAWIYHCCKQPFDRGGRWAASGKLQAPLLNRLSEHTYFGLPAPKSTGREEFTLSWLLDQLRDFSELPEQDVQATLAELSAMTIANALAAYVETSNLYLCGGGARNDYLRGRIQSYLPRCRVMTTAELGIPPDDVEAAAFAWLAHQSINHLTGNLPSVTGAREAAVLGGVYLGRI